MYKALRGGVQDVAVKVLLCTDEEQLLQFEKVRRHLCFQLTCAALQANNLSAWLRAASVLLLSRRWSPCIVSGMLAQEIGILKSISYDRNIVQFYGATMVGTEPMLLLEYCEGGDLRCGFWGVFLKKNLMRTFQCINV